MQRIPWIDPLRALAALLVLVSHVAYWSGGSTIDVVGPLLARGDVGVAVFFAVSACLLTRPACAGHALRPGYWRKRLARIVPGYAVALLAVILVAALLAPQEVTPRAVVAHLTLTQALTGDSFRGFTQAWSLTTEVTFYLAVPLIARWLRECHRRGRSPLAALAVVGAASACLQAASSSSGLAALGVVSTSAPAHAAWFCAGIAVAWCSTHDVDVPLTPPAALLSAVTLYVLVATPLGGPIHLETPGLTQAFMKELLFAAIAALLVHAATSAPDAAPPLQARLTSAGDLSYGLFLWHVLVLQVLFASLHLRIFHAPFVLVLTVTLVVSLALAAMSRHFVEAPAIRWAHRTSRG